MYFKVRKGLRLTRRLLIIAVTLAAFYYLSQHPMYLREILLVVGRAYMTIFDLTITAPMYLPQSWRTTIFHLWTTNPVANAILFFLGLFVVCYVLSMTARIVNLVLKQCGVSKWVSFRYGIGRRRYRLPERLREEFR